MNDRAQIAAGPAIQHPVGWPPAPIGYAAPGTAGVARKDR